MSEARIIQGGCRPDLLAGPPALSVIVVVYRDRQELTCLIDNLAPFRSSDVELIVIDGGSEDGSVDILEERSHEVDFWSSEPDNGIYDAMNKGITAARGNYVLHINAGDRLLKLPRPLLEIQAQCAIDVVCCRILEDDAHLFVPRNDWLLKLDNTWHHQGTFYRRTAHLGYDASYRVFGDFDHNQRMRRSGCSVELLDAVVASHQTNGISRNPQTRKEIYKSIAANFGRPYLVPAFLRFQLLKIRSVLRRGLGCVHTMS